MTCEASHIPKPQSHESPEEAGLWGSRSQVSNKGDGRAEQNDILQNVSESCQSKSARREDRNHHVGAHNRAHDSCPPPGVLERRISHDSNCMLQSTMGTALLR